MNKTGNIPKILLTAAVSLLAGACIKNDIPYPRIQAAITAFEVYGQTAAAVINTDRQTVTVDIADTVDIEKVHLKTVSFTDQAVSSIPIVSPLDLSSPLEVTLSLYQDYVWTITATQTVERAFEVANQVGVSQIDCDNLVAIAMVTPETDLSDITVTRLELGPKNITTITPDPYALKDFTSGRKVTVLYRDKAEEWTLYVAHSQVTASVGQIDAWARVAWLTGSGQSGADLGFQIRKASSQEWTTLPSSQVTVSGGTINARATGLDPQTEYVCRAYSGDSYSAESTFTTEAETALTDGGFEQWHMGSDAGASSTWWKPWEQGGTSFWDSGNKGSAIMNEMITYPSEDTPSGTGLGVYMETKYVNVFGVGKLAAGNIFTGTFVKVDGTNGVLNFGRPFTSRPTRLKGYFKYSPMPIDRTNDEWESLKGRMDSCHIYVVLGDWSEPVEIRTKPSDRKLLDVAGDPCIIAYGQLICGKEVSDWQAFDIELEYRSTSRRPTQIIVCAAASKYGDYFTGGVGSKMYVDEFTLEYDYDD